MEAEMADLEVDEGEVDTADFGDGAARELDLVLSDDDEEIDLRDI